MRPLRGSFLYTNWLYKTLNEEFLFTENMLAQGKCYCDYISHSDRVYPSTNKCETCKEMKQTLEDTPVEWDYDFARKYWIEENIYENV